jgi:hypothetical protein
MARRFSKKTRKTRKTRKNSHKVLGGCGKDMMDCPRCHASCSMRLDFDNIYTCTNCQHTTKI